MKRRLVSLLGLWLAAALLLTPVAAAKIALPDRSAVNPLLALEYWTLSTGGTAALAIGTCNGCHGQLVSVPLDRSMETALGPPAGPPPAAVESVCPGHAGSISNVVAAQEGRLLTTENWSCPDAGAGMPRTTALQHSIGPSEGHFQPVSFTQCLSTEDFFHYSVSSSYAVALCSDQFGTSSRLVAAPATGAPGQTFDSTGVAFESPALAAHFVVVRNVDANLRTAKLSVTDLSQHPTSTLYVVNARSYDPYALGPDGSLVVESAEANGCGSLASYSSSSPTKHQLPYVACGPIRLEGGHILFGAPRPDGFTELSSGDLAGGAAQPVAAVSRFEKTLDWDGAHVLANDYGCDHQSAQTFAAPGGTPDDPGPAKCPVAFRHNRTLKASIVTLYNNTASLGGQGPTGAAADFCFRCTHALEIHLRLKCPIGCEYVIHYDHNHVSSHTDELQQHGTGSFTADWVSVESAQIARLLRYQNAKRRYLRDRSTDRRARAPVRPTTLVLVTVSNRDGSTTTVSKRIPLV